MFGSEYSTIQKSRTHALFLKVFGTWDLGSRIRMAFLRKTIKSHHLACSSILDAGCGIGAYLFYLAKKFPIAVIKGMDIRKNNINACRCIKSNLNMNNISFIVGDITQHHDLGKYQLILCLDVLEHIEDDRKALNMLKFSLEKSGMLILHVPLQPQKRHFRRFASWYHPDHVREGYLEKDLDRLLVGSGFRIEKAYYTFGWFGSLAWEISEITFAVKPIFIIIFPFLLLLGYIDTLVNNRWGNCILILARKNLAK